MQGPTATGCHRYSAVRKPGIVRVLPAVRPSEKVIGRADHAARRTNPVAGPADPEQVKQRTVDEEANLVGSHKVLALKDFNGQDVETHV